MNDTKVPTAQGAAGVPPWLLLIPQLPPKPDYLRVKLRRRLQRVGAVALRNAVYVLPNRDDSTEDFMWLRAELKTDGGDAIICAAGTVAGVTDADIIALFREARDADYGVIEDEAKTQVETVSPADVTREAARLRRRLDEVRKVDFFGATKKADAERALDQLARNTETAPSEKKPGTAEVDGKVWVTRAGVFIDRIASAWLIRRFIDHSAKFKFVTPRYVPEPGDLRFDMYEAEYTHEGDHCTFETLLERFAIDDLALRSIAEIVHDIDVKDGKFERSEAAGVESIVAGIAQAEPDDERRVAQGAAIFDALYRQLTT